MAVFEVDLKYLGRFAKNFQIENPLLTQNLLQVIGIFTILSEKIVRARRLRKLITNQNARSIDIFIRIIWHAREGIKILEQYVFPMVANYGELKVVSYKLRASFYHLYVLFYNHPVIGLVTDPESIFAPPLDEQEIQMDYSSLNQSFCSNFVPSPHTGKYGYILDSNDAIQHSIDVRSDFLIPTDDYRPITLHYFQEALSLAQIHLSRSHPLRLSLMVEYSAFMYDCLHNLEESRHIAKLTVAEAYEAKQVMDTESYEDSAKFVEILKAMMEWGLNQNIDETKMPRF